MHVSDAGMSYTTRGCSADCSNSADTSTVDSLTQFVSCCTADQCNSSPPTNYPTKLTILIIIIIISAVCLFNIK